MSDVERTLADVIGDLVAGLQVPASIGGTQVLGAAYAPWQELRRVLGLGFGWYDADEARTAVANLLGDKGAILIREDTR